jgi:hypothetical protein
MGIENKYVTLYAINLSPTAAKLTVTDIINTTLATVSTSSTDNSKEINKKK